MTNVTIRVALAVVEFSLVTSFVFAFLVYVLGLTSPVLFYFYGLVFSVFVTICLVVKPYGQTL